MKNLISFEMRKLFRARVLYICAGVLVLVVLLFAGINKLQQVVIEEAYTGIPAGDGTIAINTGDDMPQELAAIMGMASSYSGLSTLLDALTNVYIIIVFAVFVAVFFCGDYGNGAIKNVFTKGYTRTQVFFSKYMVCLAVSLCYALLVMLTGFLAGLFMWGAGEGWSGKVALLILLQLLAIAGYNALFCFMAVLCKRVGAAMGAGMALTILLPLVLTLIELLADKSGLKLSRYWLSGCITAASYVRVASANLIRSAVCSGLYCALFTLFGWLIHQKREV